MPPSGTTEDSGEFLRLVRSRLIRAWLASPNVLILLGCLIAQNIWVHLGIPLAASLYPYGASGTALLFGLFLIDPLTLGYVALGARALDRALPGWPNHPDLLLAGVSGPDLRRALLPPIIVLILAEITINYSINLGLEQIYQSGFGETPLLRASHLFCLLLATASAATAILCGILIGTNSASRYFWATVGLAPILGLLFTLEWLTYIHHQYSGSAYGRPQTPGYYLAAIPVLILLHQIYRLVGNAIFQRTMRLAPGRL